jgi:hypothetical protein
MDSAMASTACSACCAVVPDKMGRQQLAALASPGFVLRPAAPGAGLPCTTSLTPPLAGARRWVLWQQSCRRPTRNMDQAAHTHVPLPDHITLNLSYGPQSQEGAPEAGQFFLGGTWPPLWAPPTIRDRSRSSSVRRVSFDSFSFPVEAFSESFNRTHLPGGGWTSRGARTGSDVSLPGKAGRARGGLETSAALRGPTSRSGWGTLHRPDPRHRRWQVIGGRVEGIAPIQESGRIARR